MAPRSEAQSGRQSRQVRFIHDSGPITYHPESTPYERRALNALTSMIEVLSRLSRELADDLETVAQAKGRAG